MLGIKEIRKQNLEAIIKPFGSAEALCRDPRAVAFTAAYYYPSDSKKIPSDGLTLAHNTFAANELVYKNPQTSKWRYAYMRDRLGGETFVDCQKTPQSEFCRQ